MQLGLVHNAKTSTAAFPIARVVDSEVNLRNRHAEAHQHETETDPEFNERYAQFLAGHLAAQGRTGKLYG